MNKTPSATTSLFLLQQKLPGDQRDVSAPDGHVSPRCVLSRPAGKTTPASTLPSPVKPDSSPNDHQTLTIGCWIRKPLCVFFPESTGKLSCCYGLKACEIIEIIGSTETHSLSSERIQAASDSAGFELCKEKVKTELHVQDETLATIISSQKDNFTAAALGFNTISAAELTVSGEPLL